MGTLLVVEQLQAYLVAQGIGQLPSVEPPSLTLPSIWLQPRQGAAMPRTSDGEWLEEATVTLNDTNLSGPPGLEPWLEDAFVDVTVRSRNPATGKLLIRSIKGLLVPVGKMSGRTDWTMGALHVQYSRLWRNDQALPPVDGGLTYDRVASFRFTCARSDLAA